jgi:hypothetical protein
LSFPVISRIAIDSSASRFDFGFSCGMLFRKSFLAAAPRLGKGDGTAQEALSQDLDGEASGAPPTLATASNKAFDAGAEGVESLAECHFLW